MIDRQGQRPLTGKHRVRVAALAAMAAYLVSQPAALATSLLFASNLGGSQWDTVRAIATDASQNIYVVGETYSQDFPGTGPSNSRASGDAFIVKLSPAGAQILYSIVLGGSGYDSARGGCGFRWEYLCHRHDRLPEFSYYCWRFSTQSLQFRTIQCLYC
jgi:hypothetical protein